jgi:hypothetical protein
MQVRTKIPGFKDKRLAVTSHRSQHLLATTAVFTALRPTSPIVAKATSIVRLQLLVNAYATKCLTLLLHNACLISAGFDVSENAPAYYHV